MFAASSPAKASQEELSGVLMEVKAGVNESLKETESCLSIAAAELSSSGIDTRQARQILRRIINLRKFSLDCATLDSSGRMVLVEPRIFKGMEGSDISRQEHIALLLDTQKPVFSRMFMAKENCYAVSFAYPVFSQAKSFVGAVSLLVRPQFMLEPIIMSIVKRSGNEIWIVQPDGVVVYDEDAEEIGKNIFTDDLYKPYPQLVSFCQIMAKDDSGSGSYRFLLPGLKEAGNKKAVWDTVSINGLEWRIVVASSVDNGAANEYYPR